MLLKTFSFSCVHINCQCTHLFSHTYVIFGCAQLEEYANFRAKHVFLKRDLIQVVGGKPPTESIVVLKSLIGNVS